VPSLGYHDCHVIDAVRSRPAVTAPGRRRAIWPAVLSVAVVVTLGFAIRLFLGLQEPLDPDEAVEGITALHILHGHLPLMESNGHYLGALESYVLAPFVALLGPTLLALRVGIAVLGAATIGATYWLGREIFGRHRDALILAAIAAVFPFFAITFAEKARNYAGLLLFETLCLALIVRIGWPTGAVRRRDWLVLGLAAGLGMWNHPLLVVPLVAGIAALLARAPALGWRRTLIGLGLSVLAGLVGYAPALAYNLQTRLGSLRHLYGPFTTYSVSPGRAVSEVVQAAIPIFVGAREVWCGRAVVPPLAADAGVILLFAAAIWIRRDRILPVLRGDVTRLEPVDMVLAVAPLALIAVTARWFNALSCEPRYLLPFALPLVVAVALVVQAIPKPLTAAAAVALLAANGMTVAFDRADGAWTVDPQVNVDAAVPALEAHHPQALWATFWLARPVQYLDGDRIPVGDYGGYVGFPESQAGARAAPHPSWLFDQRDPEIQAFEAACAQRGIQYERALLPGGLILYANLSRALVPEDLDLPTQSTAQAR